MRPTIKTNFPYLLFTLASAVFLLHCASTQATTVPKQQLAQHLANIKFDDQLLDFEVAFPLEQTEQALFQLPKVCLLTDNALFVSDDDGKTLFRYHLDGSLDKVVARQGEGPGELGRLAYATRIFANQVAFWDLTRTTIIVFSDQGDYRWEYDFRRSGLISGKAYPAPAAFAWPQKEHLILANIHVQDHADIGAASLRVVWQEDTIQRIEINQYLSHRNLKHEQKYGAAVVTQLAKVGDYYWLGSAHFSQITRLNPATQHHIAPTTSIHFPDALTPELYQNISSDDRRALFRLHNFNGSIHGLAVFPELVLVKVGALGYVPFDDHGNQLLNRKITSRVTGLRDSHQGTALFITHRRNLSLLREKSNIPIPGANLDDGDEDQPVAILARLKPAFLPNQNKAK